MIRKISPEEGPPGKRESISDIGKGLKRRAGYA